MAFQVVQVVKNPCTKNGREIGDGYTGVFYSICSVLFLKFENEYLAIYLSFPLFFKKKFLGYTKLDFFFIILIEDKLLIPGFLVIFFLFLLNTLLNNIINPWCTHHPV